MSTGLGSGGSGSEGHRGGGVMAGAHVNEASKARKARVASRRGASGLSECPRAAITKSHQLGGLRTIRNVCSHRPRGQKSKMKVSEGWLVPFGSPV